MDPASKQDLKYSYKGMINLLADKTAVGMAKIRGEESATLDVAIVKATLQEEVVPKEKHVRTLKIACSGSAPRQQVNYAIHGLAKRLEDKPGWLITLKTFIVFHRLMREVDSSFQEELLRYQERTGTQRLLRLDTFADHTTKETWDYSAWIRVYSVYLDERLAVFRLLKFDPEQETAQEGKDSKLKSCSSADLLEYLPQVHKLLSRLITCVPEGAAQRNEVVLQACAMVLREVRAVYKVVCEGVINLADKFFEMDRNDAMRGLELYKDNIALNDKLNGFFAAINNIQPLRGAVQFPTLQSLPSDFLVTLEEYVKDAPRGTGTDPVNASGRRPTTISPAMNKSAVFASRGAPTSSAISGGTTLAPTNTTSLVVGAPTTGAAPPPEPPKVIDLLDFSDSVTISPTPPATQPQAGAVGGLGSPATSQQFDFFGNPISGGVAAAHTHAAAPVAAPAPPAPQGIPGMSQSSAYMTFGAAPHAQQQMQQQMQQPHQHAPPQQMAASLFEAQAPPVYQQQHTGYGQPSAYQPQQTGYVPQQTGYQPQPTGGYVPQNTGYIPQQTGYQPQQAGGYVQQYTGQAPPAQQQAVPAYQQQQAPVLGGGGGWNAFAEGGFGSKPANGAPDQGFTPYGGAPAAPPQQQPAAPPNSSNPFGANPFTTGAAPAQHNQPQPTGGPPAGSNPFGANPFAGPAWGPPGAKGPDPLGALSADVWGGAPAAHAAAPSPPLKDIKKTNGQGSPGFNPF